MATAEAQVRGASPDDRRGRRGYPQSGILNRPPGHLLLAALTFTGDRTPAATRQAMEALREVVRKELESDLDEPERETGELGFEDGFNRDFLTITLGISSSGFEALGVPAEERPADLTGPIPWAQLGDDAPEVADNGDLVVQICSDNVYVNAHVLRRIEEELGDRLGVAWAQMGVQRFTSRAGRTARHEGRALIGFHDGTSNLHPRQDDEDRTLVFVAPGSEADYPPNPGIQSDGYSGGSNFPPDLRPVPSREPEWTRDGTYMAVRVSVNDITAWDDVPRTDQEKVIGRFKVSGASLDLEDDPKRIGDDPAFAANQADERVALDAHTRKTNPRRGEEDEKRRIYRRGYSLVQPTAQGLRRGLVFICFGRTISTQFEFIVRAWMNNPNFPRAGSGIDRLRAFDRTVLCGGYYFVPPRQYKTQPWSWIIPEVGSA